MSFSLKYGAKSGPQTPSSINLGRLEPTFIKDKSVKSFGSLGPHVSEYNNLGNVYFTVILH